MGVFKLRRGTESHQKFQGGTCKHKAIGVILEGLDFRDRPKLIESEEVGI